MGARIIGSQQLIEMRVDDSNGAIIRHGSFRDGADGDSYDYLVDIDAYREVSEPFDIPSLITRCSDLDKIALALFQKIITKEMRKNLGLWTTYSSEFNDEVPAVKAVEHLKAVLGLPRGDILKAANIPRANFHSWKRKEALAPRLGSQGDLWVWYEAVEKLQKMLGDQLPTWVANPRRRALLKTGNSEKLLSEAMAMTSEFIPEQNNFYGDKSVGEELDTPLGIYLQSSANNSDRPKRVTKTKVIR